MTATVPSIEPTQLTAGDTATWTHADGDHLPSDGWVLSYALLGAEKLVWSSGWVTDDGNTYTVTIPAASTSPLAAGTYELTRFYTLALVRDSVVLPSVAILANPANVAAGASRAAVIEQRIAVLQATLDGRATDGMMGYTVNGRQVQYLSPRELRAELQIARAELRALRNPTGFGRAVQWRFTGTSA
jgi:hypothetical protein